MLKRSPLAALLASGVLAATSAAAQAASAPPAPTLAQEAEDAGRGFVATRSDPLIQDAQGRVVWDLAAYDFLKGPPAPSVNAALWSHSALLARHGLFRVADRVWQVRGFDIANMSLVAGASGWIVIDPLTSVETARAALDLANQTLGARPVAAVIYTHPHVDHFGGARGVASEADVAAGRIQVIAPEGFLQHAVSENLIAGPAMARRAQYQFGSLLPKNATGQVGAGIGQGLSSGSLSLIPPTRTISHTGESLTVDGVEMIFQLTPGTEAPAEMNIYFPAFRVLCMAENVNVTLHNLLTPRGSLVRDGKAWADYLSEAIRLFGGRTDVMFTSHGWPRFGAAEVSQVLRNQRDGYKFIHDQSVRLMNNGLTGPEIGAQLRLPPALAEVPYEQSFYGDLSFNARSVYQRYLGWYDGDPAHLTPIGPADAGRRYVQAMGGRKHVLALAERAFRAGDLPWSAVLLDHLVMANGRDTAARAKLARVYERLGQSAENATWRNMYLSAAAELAHGSPPPARAAPALDMLRNTPSEMLFDVLAVRLDPDLARHLVIDVRFTDRGEAFRLTVENGVLIHEPVGPGASPAKLHVELPRTVFVASLGDPGILAKAESTGDIAALQQLLSWTKAPTPMFPLVWRNDGP